MNFDKFERVEVQGQSGGIWLLWHSSTCKLVVVSKCSQFIHATVGEDAGLIHVLVVYACPDVQRRAGLWQALSAELEGIDQPCVLGGDFNVIQSLNERKGGSNILSADSIHFGDWIHRNNLIDLGFHGSPFTWARGSEAVGLIQKRLDRVLVNMVGRLCWPEAVVHYLPRFCSDHNPLLIQFKGRPSGDPCRRPFRFQAAWISHPRFHDFLTDKWKSREDLPVALETLKHDLCSWNKRVFGDVHERKNSLMQQMDDLQRRLARAPTDAALLLNRKIQEELDLTLEQEEMVWFQKSRQQWISCGDRNTKFFHMSTVMRRRSNRILSLKVDADRWCVDPVRLENHATQFFRSMNYWNDEEGWDLSRLSVWLPEDVLLRLASVGLTESWEGNDTVSWSPSTSGKFSSASAYSILRGTPNMLHWSENSFKSI
ncbi:hypothetical protein V2J09_012766 [Rumex salicifolius]